MKQIKQAFDRLVSQYPRKIIAKGRYTKKELNNLTHRLQMTIPKELEFYLMNYNLNLLNTDYDILSLNRIIEETIYLRDRGINDDFLVISAYDEFFLCLVTSPKEKEHSLIMEITMDLEKKFAYKNLVQFLEKIIKHDIEWEEQIEEEEKNDNRK